jgi:uncharacterized protein YeaO (DUF488 family)
MNISLIVRRPKNADEEGCNYHEYESNLSPSKKLLNDYQYGWKYGRPMKWEEFKEEFKKEIIGNADAQKKIREFANRCLKGETITLLCYWKNKNKCHRFIIKEFIEKEKEKIEEEEVANLTSF